MKKVVIACLAVLLLAGISWLGLSRLHFQWSGVDETVVERFAEQAGRPPRPPLINTDQGDLLLFVFLLAGSGGGFLAGYCFRELFSPEDG